MRRAIRRMVFVVLVAALVTVAAYGEVFAYELNGTHIGGDVWYRTTNSFTSETREGARLAMVAWNKYLPEGQRVCFNTSFVSEPFYPRKNLVNAITKISSTKSYLGENAIWKSSNGAVAESDINVNASQSWWNNPPSGYYDPQSCLLHELGHTVGLSHSTQSNAVMYSILGPGVTKRTLHSDDIAGVRKLY